MSPTGSGTSLITEPDRQHTTTVAGARVRWMSWGETSLPPVVFVHGGAAHAWWWSWTVPQLADRFHVIALDLTGHGDSDHRPDYTFHLWAQEVLTVAAVAGGGRPPVLVGHSMGGLVTALAAAVADVPLDGLVVIESPLGPVAQSATRDSDALLAREKRYPSVEVAVSRFRPVPPQEDNLDWAVRFIAERSVRDRGDGWGWKYDQRMFSHHPADRPDELLATLALVRCRLAVINAGRSAVVDDDAHRRFLAAAVDRQADHGPMTVRRIEDGGHHLMFDRPAELLAEIERVLEAWRA
ncbi:alpha/beta fold hydrolase [Nakamurella sp. YIM 132087]|uniref:Alpha/beta fold hydrolase n=1 Tax=Nakamurella alba TaxID=2665158 RepID=A0A7K1FH23_9ACTN|nr:alpha/beta hydrolase [Nakamurella alba]MTD13421.1 alpha/beta fold hydrolase [Nakamurella alba]